MSPDILRTTNLKKAKRLTSALLSAALLAGCGSVQSVPNQLNGAPIIDCADRPGEAMTVRLNPNIINHISGEINFLGEYLKDTEIIPGTQTGQFTAITDEGNTTNFGIGKDLSFMNNRNETYLIESLPNRNLVLTVFCIASQTS